MFTSITMTSGTRSSVISIAEFPSAASPTTSRAANSPNNLRRASRKGGKSSATTIRTGAPGQDVDIANEVSNVNVLVLACLHFPQLAPGRLCKRRQAQLPANKKERAHKLLMDNGRRQFNSTCNPSADTPSSIFRQVCQARRLRLSWKPSFGESGIEPVSDIAYRKNAAAFVA
jgi:hypothetical protein